MFENDTAIAPILESLMSACEKLISMVTTFPYVLWFEPNGAGGQILFLMLDGEELCEWTI
jgi:hypothetical protein